MILNTEILKKIDPKYLDTKYYLVILILPIFFTLTDGLFDRKVVDLSGARDFLTKPFPISFFMLTIINFCLFFLNFNKKFILYSFYIFFFLFFTYFLNLIFFERESLKNLIYFLQFLYPISYLISGLLLNINIKKNLYFFLIPIVTIQVCQILVTLSTGYILLRDNIIFFTLHQNLQYTNPTLIFLNFFFIFFLDIKKKQIPFYLVNVLSAFLSFNFSSIFLIIIGSIILFRSQIKLIFNSLIFLSLLIFMFSNIELNSKYKEFQHEANFKSQTLHDLVNGKLPQNIKDRIIIYKDFVNEEYTLKNIFLGKDNVKTYTKYHGLHNYLFNIFYLFGVFPLVLIVFLFFYFFKIFITKTDNNEKFKMSFFLFFIVLENIFKSAAMQPYPGSIIYFLLGYYLKKYNENLK